MYKIRENYFWEQKYNRLKEWTQIAAVTLIRKQSQKALMYYFQGVAFKNNTHQWTRVQWFSDQPQSMRGSAQASLWGVCIFTSCTRTGWMYPSTIVISDDWFGLIASAGAHQGSLSFVWNSDHRSKTPKVHGPTGKLQQLKQKVTNQKKKILTVKSNRD